MSPRTLRAIGVALAVGLSACSTDDQQSADTTTATTTVAAVNPTATIPTVTTISTTSAPVATTAAPPALTTAPATVATPPTTAVTPTDSYFVDSYGRFDVGVTTVEIADTTGRDRPLTVDVWFPLDAPGGAFHQYTLLPEVYFESPFAYTADAAEISTAGPFPLVVYSHGSGGLRYIDSNYTEAIASHGYIVVAPDHSGNTALDDLGGTGDSVDTIAFNRPNDITAVIDAALDPGRELGDFAGSIAADQIAVTGHSFGGFTALAVAGGFENANGTYAADERVGAIIPLAPAAFPELISDASLAAIDVPMLVMVGTDDITTPPSNVDRIVANAPSTPLYRADLVAAEHQTFTDVCDYQVQLAERATPAPVIETVDEVAEQGCSPDDMPIARAQLIINSLASAFLNSVFYGDLPIDPSDLDGEADVIYTAN